MNCIAPASFTHTHAHTAPLGLHCACEFYTHTHTQPHMDCIAPASFTHTCCRITHAELELDDRKHCDLHWIVAWRLHRIVAYRKLYGSSYVLFFVDFGVVFSPISACGLLSFLPIFGAKLVR